jgi:hypothetical protein
LTRRGWLEPAAMANAYGVTAAGRAARALVEQLTDNYFYTPWSCLPEAQIAELRALLLRFTQQLQSRA